MFSSNSSQVSSNAVFVEEIFQTYLYTGNGSTQTITNGIDLSTYGGLVWMKARSNVANNVLSDTARGNFELASNSVAAQLTGGISYGTTGFTVDNSTSNYGNNSNNYTYASWTFRKQPKFFDVVTYTGTGSNTTIAHALGAVPGSIIVKRTDTTAAWAVYHRSLANTQYLVLNTTAAAATGATWWNSTTATSAVFSLGTSTNVNASGGTYVAYLFAHDAGGFGLTGTDNVISCGSFTGGAASWTDVSLGYEPQWILWKASSGADSWYMYDNMRGLTADGNNVATLFANSSAAEAGNYGNTKINSTGFSAQVGNGTTYIYIAIRRGPMKVPTLGTQVYNGVTRTGTGSATNVTGAGFPPDLVILESLLDPKGSFSDRLRGPTQLLNSYQTAAEATDTNGVTSFSMDGMAVGVGNAANRSGFDYVYWFLRRYPSVFDEVCYTGTDTGTRILDHNLTVTPELVIVKKRSAALDWAVQASTFTTDNILFLNTTAALTSTPSYLSYPEQNTSTTFKVRYNLNVISETYVAYLFATCAGVSKVGTYTGNGSTQTINCGFTAGARFVLLKRTDSTGDWYVYDTARGMTVLTNPYLRLNVNSAEVATLGSVTTVATGFALDSSILAAINVNAGTYIFLSVA